MSYEQEIGTEVDWLRQQITIYTEYIKNVDNTFVSHEDMLILCGYERRLAKLVPSPYVPPKPLLLQTTPSKNFAAENPRTKSITNLRVDANMTRAEFSKYFHIPYRTVENWEKNTNKCPEYLFDLIEYKLDAEELRKEK